LSRPFPADQPDASQSRDPQAAACLDNREDGSISNPALWSAHLLVVDDDPAITAGTARLLSRDGYSTTQANSGEQALRLAAQMPPDLILLDVMLPDIGGLEVCRRLKADPRTSQAFVVLCSALRTDGNAVVQGVDAGADGYLSRPIENRELLARVQAYLRHKTTIDALRDSERHWREQFERERQASYDAEIMALGQSASGALPVSARLLGIGPLSETAPAAFAELQAEYGSLLGNALEQRIFRVENMVTLALRDLAERLFQLRAGARDVTELHYRALSARAVGEPPGRARALMEAGRLTLLELMGRVLNAYRSRQPELRGRPEAVLSANEQASP
jgi:DNA-binding response OmpR family regulator